jgi:tetratricopeptide (TPR) repeat protein
VYGKKDTLLASTYNSIGLIYFKQGKHQEALNELDKALEIQEKALGKDHTSTKHTQKNIDYIKKSMAEKQ